jgi:hypothetical protein
VATEITLPVIQSEVCVRLKDISLLVVVILGLYYLQAQSQAPASPTVTLQAELLKTLDASHIKPGDEVTARTATPLEFGGARFPVGATVVGHITKAEPNLLILVFDQITVKKTSSPLSLSLRAVMMPHAAPPAMSERISPTAEALGGVGLLRSPQTAAQDSTVSIFDSSQHPVMAGNGGVIGLSGVKLLVSSDPNIGSALQADPNQRLKLEKGLQLMFVVAK